MKNTIKWKSTKFPYYTSSKIYRSHEQKKIGIKWKDVTANQKQSFGTIRNAYTSPEEEKSGSKSAPNSAVSWLIIDDQELDMIWRIENTMHYLMTQMQGMVSDPNLDLQLRSTYLWGIEIS